MKAEDLPTNWGRWGTDDELGTLNLITPEVRARAVAEARTGRSVSIARRIPTAPVVAGPSAAAGASSVSAMQIAMYTGADVRQMAELFILMSHSPEVTHFDALAHQVLDGQVYPGRPLGDAGGPAGLQHGSTAAFAHGVVTRGVLLDLAPDGALKEGHPVTGADLQAAADRTGVEVLPGDAIVVRGGWDYATNRERQLPGMTLDAIRWMQQHDIAVYAGDIGDAHPPVDPEAPGALHRIGLARLGMPLIDVADPTDLAAACTAEQRWSFLLVAAPPRLEAASGVPVNPVAIF